MPHSTSYRAQNQSRIFFYKKCYSNTEGVILITFAFESPDKFTNAHEYVYLITHLSHCLYTEIS